MQPQLVDELPLDRPTREFYRTMPAPARAWALAKAAFETAQEANFEEQRAAVKAATADDPEPPFYDQLPETATREDVRVAMDLWRAWSDRNRARVDAATKPIVARYPNNLKKLAKLAEENLVAHAEERLKAHFPDRFEGIKPAFDAYRANTLYGDKHDQFINICFNCPVQ